RAEAGVRGDGRADIDLVSAPEGVGLRKALQRLERPAAIGPLGHERAAARKDKLRCRSIYGKPNAAEPAPQPAVEVEEAQMQARRRDDTHSPGAGPRTSRSGGSICRRVGLRCVGQRHYGEPSAPDVVGKGEETTIWRRSAKSPCRMPRLPLGCRKTCPSGAS